MELREKIVREAFAKKDVKQLLSHLRAISLGAGCGAAALQAS